MVCSKCGKELPDDARFCLTCGNPIGQDLETKLGSTPERPPAPISAARPKTDRLCPKCGKLMPHYVRFCYECKSPMDDTTMGNDGSKSQEPVSDVSSQTKSNKKNVANGCLISIALVVGFFFFILIITAIFSPPSDTKSLVIEARKSFTKGNYATAVGSFKKGLELWDNDEEYDFDKNQIRKELKIAKVNYAQQKVEQALEDLNKGSIDDAALCIDQARELDANNAQLGDLTEKINQAYVQEKMQQAKAALKNKNFEEAKRLVDDAKKRCLDKNTDLQSLYDDITIAQNRALIDDHMAKARSALQSNDNATWVTEIRSAANIDTKDKALQELRKEFETTIKSEVNGYLKKAKESLDNYILNDSQENVKISSELLPEDKDVIAINKKLQEVTGIINSIGPKPENSSWDGSVQCVSSFLRNNLKDPGSLQYIEWSPVFYMPRGSKGYWAVRCKYRAKNSFGGYVVDEQIFLMQDGYVVDYYDYGY